MSPVETAERLARIALDEETFRHSRRVADRMESGGGRIVAWLHDVVEDSRVTLEDLVALGFHMGIVNSVDELTRKAGESYREYIRRIRDSERPLAIAVKIADLLDHLEQADTLPESLRPRYERALAQLSPSAAALRAHAD